MRPAIASGWSPGLGLPPCSPAPAKACSLRDQGQSWQTSPSRWCSGRLHLARPPPPHCSPRAAGRCQSSKASRTRRGCGGCMAGLNVSCMTRADGREAAFSALRPRQRRSRYGREKSLRRGLSLGRTLRPMQSPAGVRVARAASSRRRRQRWSGHARAAVRASLGRAAAADRRRRRPVCPTLVAAHGGRGLRAAACLARHLPLVRARLARARPARTFRRARRCSPGGHRHSGRRSRPAPVQHGMCVRSAVRLG